jgi:hypothetical protein
MPLFRICVRCDCIPMTVNGQSGAYGFYKNEYVRATDSAAAAQAAKLKVRAALRSDPPVTAADAASQEIAEIEEGVDEAALSADEGFVFFESEGG